MPLSVLWRRAHERHMPEIARVVVDGEAERGPAVRGRSFRTHQRLHAHIGGTRRIVHGERRKSKRIQRARRFVMRPRKRIHLPCAHARHSGKRHNTKHLFLHATSISKHTPSGQSEFFWGQTPFGILLGTVPNPFGDSPHSNPFGDSPHSNHRGQSPFDI